MGLDMYLKNKVYIGAEYDHREIAGVIYITASGKQIPINFNKVSYIEETAGYWRKANHIHQWFVDNVQNGENDCKEYYVDIDQIKGLKSLCKEVLKDREKAAVLLPTSEGFFYGGQEYDEWYFDSLKETIEILSNVEDSKGEIYYSSSW